MRHRHGPHSGNALVPVRGPAADPSRIPVSRLRSVPSRHVNPVSPSLRDSKIAMARALEMAAATSGGTVNAIIWPPINCPIGISTYNRMR
jgi:hypothetical protein